LLGTTSLASSDMLGTSLSMRLPGKERPQMLLK
jgi:hypothetical protein